MRRKEAIACAKIGAKRFDAYGQKGLFPFPTKDKGWSDYSLDDVFKLRLMLDLVDEGGCAIQTALKVIHESIQPDKLAFHPLDLPKDQPEDVFVSAVTFGVADRSHTVTRTIAGTLGGLRGEIAAAISESESYVCVRRIISANATEAAASVRYEAHKLGLDVATDMTPQWEGRSVEEIAQAYIPPWVKNAEANS